MCTCVSVSWGSQDSMLVECRTHDRKVASSNPGRSGGSFLLQSQLCVLTLIRCPFHPCVTAVARKRPRTFCHSAGGRLHPHMRTPLTQRSPSGLTMLSRNSMGTYSKTSSLATRRGTQNHSRLSSLSHCRPILAYRVELVYADYIST